MTVAQKRQLTVGIATALIGGLALIAAQGVAAQVVLRPEIDARFARSEAEIAARIYVIEADIRDLKSIALDMLCADQPTHRRCHP